jgi:hypothetical protein
MQSIDMNYKMVVDKTTVIYGETGTGKSTIIVDILHSLSEHVDQIVVFSPTDNMNKTYGNGLVPLPCIHYTITADKLQAVYDRQEALVATWSRANNIKTIDALFGRIPNANEIGQIVREIKNKFDNIKNQISDIDEQRTRLSDLSDECNRIITNIKKKCITDHRSSISMMDLSSDEKFSLKYINLNPKLVLIFDDCTPELKAMSKKSAVFQKFFCQGRHLQTTVIIACHTDVCLPPDIKKNVFVSMFTSPKCATATFERASGNLTKEDKIAARNAVSEAFMEKYGKLVCIRDGPMYKYCAHVHKDFKFGSKYIWELCRMIENDGQSIANNRFIGLFN